MGKIAFVFSGQGAQKPGMGLELAETSAEAKAVFDQIDAMRPGTSQQCFAGTEEELKETSNTQPCMFAVELAGAAALNAAGIKADMAAGFSLGEIAALTYTGAVDFKTGFNLVCRRGEFMQQDAEKRPSAMCAALKLTDDKVEELCANYKELYPVNYNCPGQISVAGSAEEMPDFMAAVKAAGGRAVPLKVQGAFHSPYMAGAAEAFGEVLKTAEIKTPEIPLYSNYTAQPYAGDYRELLSKQIANPVRWEKIVRNMIAEGVDTFIECGPGTTLCGLIKKISSDVRIYNVADKESLAKVLAEVK